MAEKTYSARRWALFFDFLDELRESGVTNMFGSVPYVMKAFNLSRVDASHVVGRWMKTFDREKSPSERVNQMLAAASRET